MTRLLYNPLRLILFFNAFSTGFTNGLNLEEQMQQLRENFIDLAAKNTKLEGIVVELETKVLQLETKILQQESLLSMPRKNQHSMAFAQTDNRNAEINVQLAANGKGAIPRTCFEARAADPSLPSGMYWIDPDGQGVGDSPIYVYCTMSSGYTSVLHDSESQLDVGHCADPGCYSRAINYNATDRQIRALAELSSDCHQSIRYDCTSAPFEVNGVSYSWWNDKDGNPQYFWAGSNSSVHICQCGMDHNCVESFMPCNCDSGLPTPLYDDGVIRNKDILPITRLNFGRTILESSSGLHTLGRFQCNGQVAVTGMPKSCEDLWRIGHTLSGLYSVMGTEYIESVYCDFTLLPSESGFQTWIGNIDVKSLPVYFYVQRETDYNTTKTPMPFEVGTLNVGNAMNLTSGIFTAPRSGRYFFSFNGFAYIGSGSSASHIIDINLMLNGGHVVTSYADENDTGTGTYENLSLQATLQLSAGDKIWLQLDFVTSGACLRDDRFNFNHFSGWLLEEDIRSSLP